MDEKVVLRIINQLFEMEKKLIKTEHGALRNLDRTKSYFGDLGWEWENPLGQQYAETRTDIQAEIVGNVKDGLTITEVIKPIVFRDRQIVQQGVVIAE